MIGCKMKIFKIPITGPLIFTTESKFCHFLQIKDFVEDLSGFKH
jgi:hypothetical protein